MATNKPQKPITDEIATFEKDIFRDFVVLGNTVLNPDRVLKSEGGGKGVDLYDDLLRESQVTADLNTRKNAVTGREWDVLPASDKRADTKIAEFCKQVLVSSNHASLQKAFFPGLVLGYKPVEIMWDYSEGDVFIKEFRPRASRRFTFGTDRGLRMLTLGNMVEGEQVPDKKFQLFVNPSDNGSPFGDALGRALYWPVWFKKNSVKFVMVFADKFGSPTAVGKYPPATGKDLQDKLLDACAAIQQESAIAIPNTMMIEFLEAARTSSMNIYEFLLTYWDKQISKVILGHADASSSTPGQLGGEGGKSRVQQVQDKNLKDDADLLCEQENNQVIRWIVDYNFPGVKQYPKLWIRTEEEKDMLPQAQRDQVLVSLGLPIAERYFYDQYGQDMKPEDGEPVVKAPEPAVAPPLVGGVGEGGKGPGMGQEKNATFKECGCGRKHKHPLPSRERTEVRGGLYMADFAEADWVAEYMQRLQPALQGAQQSALDDIAAWLLAQDVAPTEEAFNAKIKDILGSAYANIDTTEVAAVVADMWGAFKGTAPIDAIATGASTFGGADLRAINWLSDVDSMFYGKYISNPDAQAAFTEFLKEQYLKNGHGLFGRGNQSVIDEFKNLLAQKGTEVSAYQIQRIADTSVQRIRGFAKISQFSEAAIPVIKIVEPTHECGFCAEMNGQEIQVETAYDLMQKLMDMTPEDYVGHLQDNPATLGEKKDGEYEGITNTVDMGMLPPYHPNCHGDFVKG